MCYDNQTIKDTAGSSLRVSRAGIIAAGHRAGTTAVRNALERMTTGKKAVKEADIEKDRFVAKRGVGLVSLTEHIDTTTPGGVLVFHVFGVIAQFERALIRERTAGGLAEARRRGRKGGRPPAFNEADVVAARALMADGKLPVRAIAKRMGVSIATLYRHVGKRGRVDEGAEPQPLHG